MKNSMRGYVYSMKETSLRLSNEHEVYVAEEAIKGDNSGKGAQLIPVGTFGERKRKREREPAADLPARIPLAQRLE